MVKPAGGQGGNLYAGSAYNASVQLKNTLLRGGSPNNCSSTILSNGNNLEDANTCGLTAGGDLKQRNPSLGFLALNGGTTLTYALMPFSPAIDAGSNTGCPLTDQRGVARPMDGNRSGPAVCDIGAYEFNPNAPLLVFLPLVKR